MTVAGLVFIAIGIVFLLVAAIGLIRLPDALQRMHSATKAGTLGTAMVVIGALMIGDVARPVTGVLTILFLLLTLPIGAQLLGRATYLSRAPMKGIDDDPLAAELNHQNPPSPSGEGSGVGRLSEHGAGGTAPPHPLP